jgi:uncharacterized protein (DUF433 family)
MNTPSWKNYIESSPEVLRGKPCFVGSRIPVGLILGYLAEKYTIPQIVEEFPDLTEEHITACLSYARDLASFELAT